MVTEDVEEYNKPKNDIYIEKNSSSNFTQLSIKVGTCGQVRNYLVSL